MILPGALSAHGPGKVVRVASKSVTVTFLSRPGSAFATIQGRKKVTVTDFEAKNGASPRFCSSGCDFAGAVDYYLSHLTDAYPAGRLAICIGFPDYLC